MHAHLDCPAGISGDMFLGALVDAGLPIAVLDKRIGHLVPGRTIQFWGKRVQRAGIAAIKVEVEAPDDTDHRHLPEILRLLKHADLPQAARELAMDVFHRLAVAEATVHGTTPERIHFHEVGALDAIADIAGVALGIAELGLTNFSCSTITVGAGYVECMHGLMPVPAPATAVLLQGFPTRVGPIEKEMTTPTGAALLGALVDKSVSSDGLVATRVGHGAGSRDFKTFANVTRLMIGERRPDDAAQRFAAVHTSTDHQSALVTLPVLVESLVVLEADIDDATGEQAGAWIDSLIQQGARDAKLIPTIMKKGRPGAMLSVLLDPERVAMLAEWIFKNTPTLGLRMIDVKRASLPRSTIQVDPRADGYGPIPFKVAEWNGEVIHAKPDFDSCLAIARKLGIPVEEVQRQAVDAWREQAKT